MLKKIQEPINLPYPSKLKKLLHIFSEIKIKNKTNGSKSPRWFGHSEKRTSHKIIKEKQNMLFWWVSCLLTFSCCWFSGEIAMWEDYRKRVGGEKRERASNIEKMIEAKGRRNGIGVVGLGLQQRKYWIKALCNGRIRNGRQCRIMWSPAPTTFSKYLGCTLLYPGLH